MPLKELYLSINTLFSNRFKTYIACRVLLCDTKGKGSKTSFFYLLNQPSAVCFLL
jgi:hypothetical protein